MKGHSMLELFYPGEYVDSAYDIPYEDLYEQGYRGIIYDIDNTLVPHGAPADDRSVALFKRLHDTGFETCLISNNDEGRVKPFADKVDSKYISKAGKPSVKAYSAAMEKMGTVRFNTMIIGDQLFTDIYGANRAGIFSYLVKPVDKKEEVQIVLKRRFEKIVLYFYDRRLKRM